MKFKDYYEVLGLARDATQDEVKQAYRKLARKFHPDVSTAPDAEARFKEVGEAYAVLKDTEKRAAYDQVGSQWKSGQDFQPPPDWDAGFEFAGSGEGADGDASEFFEALFGRRGAGGPRASSRARGRDHHAKVRIDLEDAFRGARRSVTLRLPTVDAHGRVAMTERTLEVTIPKGIREGQHLRLAGQGDPGTRDGPPGDLYLEIAFNPHPRFRVEGRDVFVNLRLAPWEAALGTSVTAPTPDGPVALTIPPDSASGRRLRLKGRGLPGTPPGDLFVVLEVVLPPADTAKAREAYRAMAAAFEFDPRAPDKE